MRVLASFSIGGSSGLAARRFLIRKKNMAAMASSARMMIGTATPMPIFAPVDIPPLFVAAAGIDVAAGVGAVCVAPVFAAPVAVLSDIRFIIFWSLSCHCIWITSAIMVPTPPPLMAVVPAAPLFMGSMVVKETPLGMGSLLAVEVKYTLFSLVEKMLAHA